MSLLFLFQRFLYVKTIIREVLQGKTYDTYEQGSESSFLIAYFLQQHTRRNTHEEVGHEVHQVTPRSGELIFEAPDVAKGSSHVRDEADHREDETHGDNRHEVGVFACTHC